MPFRIVYADAYLLVVEKPAGQVVHPTHANTSGTLWDDVLAWAAHEGGGERPGLVHRLDKDTSGLLVLARTPAAHRHMHHQFEHRRVVKGYLALVDGVPAVTPFALESIEAPLARDATDRRRVAVVPEGSAAWTDYMVVRRWAAHALVRLWPRTGRTHQLRVHLASLGLPICGDPVYNAAGTSPGGRLFLHADSLAFQAPDGMYRTFHASLPPELKRGLRELSGERE